MLKSALGLITLGMASLASAMTAPVQKPHFCNHFPTKVSKLSSCPTASAFCSSYIGGPTGTLTFTKTRTVTTTRSHSHTIVTSTSTTYTTSYTDTTTITQQSTSTAPTSTTYATSCSQNDKRSLAARKASASCGIVKTAAPSQISSACDCILAPTSTATKTVTRFGSKTATISTTTTETHTVTTESTTTTTLPDTTVTPTACATGCPGQFYLSAFGSGTQYDGNYAVINSDSSNDEFLVMTGTTTAPAAIFSLDSNQELRTTGPQGQEIANVDTDFPDEDLFFNTQSEINNYNYVVASCNFVGSGFELQCTDYTDSEFYLDGAILKIVTPGEQATGEVPVNVRAQCL